MIGRHSSENVRTVTGLVVPFILVFGVYVVAHGHYGPGGGFAGGAILAVGVIVTRFTLDSSVSERLCPQGAAVVALMGGMALFLLAALVPLGVGGVALDYADLPAGDLSDPTRRYLGIFVVEVGVGAAVFGGILFLFDQLAGSEDD